VEKISDNVCQGRLADLRGPVKATAAWRARACWTAVCARRGIILAYYPWRG
jgi:hypothetical protein